MVKFENNISSVRSVEDKPQINSIYNRRDLDDGSHGSSQNNFPSRVGSSGRSFSERLSESLPKPEENLRREYDRGFNDGYNGGFEDGDRSGWNRHVNAVRPVARELSSLELGAKEKARILAKLQESGLAINEALVIERSAPEQEEGSPLIYTTDIALRLDGIRSFLRMEVEGVEGGPQNLTSTPIPLEEYPRYSQLADAAIQKYSEIRASRSK